MSQKVAKRERRELKEREQAFLKGMDELSREHKIGLQPVLQFTPTGVVPAMRLIDEVGQYENITPEAAAQNESERAAKSEAEKSPDKPADPAPAIEPA